MQFVRAAQLPCWASVELPAADDDEPHSRDEGRTHPRRASNTAVSARAPINNRPKAREPDSKESLIPRIATNADVQAATEMSTAVTTASSD
jgi:hypothetical protein